MTRCGMDPAGYAANRKYTRPPNNLRGSGFLTCRLGTGSASLGEERVQFRQHFKRVGHVKHVRFSSRPSAVRVEIHGAAFVDEAPAHDVRSEEHTSELQSRQYL